MPISGLVEVLDSTANQCLQENSELPECAIFVQKEIGEREADIAELQGLLQELSEDVCL